MFVRFKVRLILPNPFQGIDIRAFISIFNPQFYYAIHEYI